MSSPTKVEVYIDYVCPWAYRSALWLRDLKVQLGDELQITWKFFSLEQVNSKHGEDWRVWNQPIDHLTKGFIGFRGALAARKQGEDAFENFHFAWFDARHGASRRASVRDVAADAGLDLEQFDRDFNDPAVYRQLGCDHERAVEQYGVFGTPAFVFENGANAYFQLKEVPDLKDAVQYWREFMHLVVDRPAFQEIKRSSPHDSR